MVTHPFPWGTAKASSLHHQHKYRPRHQMHTTPRRSRIVNVHPHYTQLILHQSSSFLASNCVFHSSHSFLLLSSFHLSTTVHVHPTPKACVPTRSSGCTFNHDCCESSSGNISGENGVCTLLNDTKACPGDENKVCAGNPGCKKLILVKLSVVKIV